jgi:5-formyltetrahydrofolate cyclo-ligase
MAAAERAEADADVARFAASLAAGVAVAAAYVPMTGEPGGPLLLDALASTGVRLLLPVLRDDRDLDWAVYSGVLGSPVGEGPRARLREPTGPTLGVDAIATAEVVIVPAVAVADSGIRLGRGGGSYDRALARARGLVVALLYPGEVVPELPAEPHDRSVHLAYAGRPYWTEAGRMTHHWHSTVQSANDGG